MKTSLTDTQIETIIEALLATYEQQNKAIMALVSPHEVKRRALQHNNERRRLADFIRDAQTESFTKTQIQK